MKGLSLFSSAGIAEMMLSDLHIDFVVANELIPIRAKTYSYWHPSTKMICGDITLPETKNTIIESIKNVKIDFMLITPPCQGVSLIGKNKNNEQMLQDNRNYLLFDALHIVEIVKPDYVLIENVPRYFNILFNMNGKEYSVIDVIKERFSNKYIIESGVYNAADYGVPQNRQRAIIKIYRKNLKWNEPQKSKSITVREAIGDLPSLESGQRSNLKNHVARIHTDSHIQYMKNTPTGKSAFENEFYYPKDLKTGVRLKGYSATYKRIEWDKPAPTITMRNDAISSQSNVHPGRQLEDGTYSDARVLTLREIFILSSMNPDLDLPNGVSEIQIRHMVGEAVPPLLIKKIVEGIV